MAAIGKLIHADWSKNHAKRWAAFGSFESGERFDIQRTAIFHHSPQELSALAEDRGVLLGFDFPIGVPAFYARAAGVDRFADLLDQLFGGPFSDFARPGLKPEDISVPRPFYPAIGKGAKQADLLAAFGLSVQNDLRRVCERSPYSKPAASPLFWTVGAAQVGLAAAAGWKEMIQPLRSRGSARLWPFDGVLTQLLKPSGVTIVETYPAEAARFLGIHPGSGFSKSKLDDRRAVADRILASAERLGAGFAPEVERDVRAGFESHRGGDDAFDAVIGLLGMLAVVRGDRQEGTPSSTLIRRIEGWILGMDGSSFYGEASEP